LRLRAFASWRETCALARLVNFTGIIPIGSYCSPSYIWRSHTLQQRFMPSRIKVLVVVSDLAALSRVYLALLHKNYRTEATDKSEGITERIKRMKPSVIVLGMKEYQTIKNVLKIPAVLLVDPEEEINFLPGDIIQVQKPFTIQTLIRSVESRII
jgi:hypothetical protein